jgi:hypothetical protein
MSANILRTDSGDRFAVNRRFSNLAEAIAQRHEPSATQLARLETSYESTADFLAARPEFAGLLQQIHAHGSRQLGTMVRPTATSREGFDVDLIALLDPAAAAKWGGEQGPAKLLNEFFAALNDYARAHDLEIKRHQRCVTLTYADGMSADIAPVIANPKMTVLHGDTHGLIPDRGLRSFEATNPKGYARVFNDIAAITPNFPGLVVRADAMDSAERAEIISLPKPEEVFGRLLCRFVQLMKLHRNARFCHTDEMRNLAPSSIFLTTLAANAYSQLARIPHSDPLTLLIDIARALPNSFDRENNGRAEEWHLPNPSAPQDNLASAMNTQQKQAAFGWWVDGFIQDLELVKAAIEQNQGIDALSAVVRTAFGERASGAVHDHLLADRQRERLAGQVSAVSALGSVHTLPSKAHTFDGD